MQDGHASPVASAADCRRIEIRDRRSADQLDSSPVRKFSLARVPRGRRHSPVHRASTSAVARHFREISEPASSRRARTAASMSIPPQTRHCCRNHPDLSRRRRGARQNRRTRHRWGLWPGSRLGHSVATRGSELAPYEIYRSGSPAPPSPILHPCVAFIQSQRP